MRPTWRQPAVLGFQGGGGKGGKALHQHWLASNLRSQHADTQDRRIDTLPPLPLPPSPYPWPPHLGVQVALDARHVAPNLGQVLERGGVGQQPRHLRH
jgi:hypothetical protein